MSSLGVFAKAFGMADDIGKCIYLFLFILSFLVVSIAIERSILLFKMRKHRKDFLSTFIDQKVTLTEMRSIEFPLDYLYQSIHKTALQLLEKNRHFVKESGAPVFLSRGDIDALRNKMDCSLSEIEMLLKKKLFLLSAAVTLGPFVGILGTVWGLLLSFGVLGRGGGAGSELLGGLATALATTAIGLMIAIPAMIALSLLKAGADEYISETALFGEKVLASVELHYRRVEQSS